MPLNRHLASLVVGAALLAGLTEARANLTIEFDYSLDTSNFFTAAKRQVLNQVASIFETNLDAHRHALNNITLSLANFHHGSGPTFEEYAGTSVHVDHQTLATDTVRIYVGATDLVQGDLGLSWVGSLDGFSGSGIFGGLNGGWGGAMLFDTTEDFSAFDGYYSSHGKVNPYAGLTRARDWYVDADIRTTEVQNFEKLPAYPDLPFDVQKDDYWELPEYDFASVVMHEMGHVFGLQHSGNRFDAMYATTGGRRTLFDQNDWQAMQAGGWRVNSLTPGIPAPEVQPAVDTPDGRLPEPWTPLLVMAALSAAWLARRTAS